MYYPPVASSVLSTAWKDEQYSGFAPSGIIYESWQVHRILQRRAYLAYTLNHYEDLGSRNRFIEDSPYSTTEPTENAFIINGEVPWIVAKFKGKSPPQSSLLTSSSYYKHTNTPYKFYYRPTKTNEFPYVNSGENQAIVFPVGPLLNSESIVFPNIPLDKYYRVVWNIEYNTTLKKYVKNTKNPYYNASAAVSIFRLQFEVNDNLDTRQVYIAFDAEKERITNTQKDSRLVASKLNVLSSNYLSAVNTTLLVIFREYCHYIGNPEGGTGLIDLTPFTVNATTLFQRQLKTDIYSAYGTDNFEATIDYNNQVTPVKLWPKKYLTGLQPEE